MATGFGRFGRKCHMKQPVRPKQIAKRQFIAEWMKSRDKTPADLMRALDVDKSQVYRWLKGQIPHRDMEKRIADFFETAPEALRRHPDVEWIGQFFEGRDDRERDRIKQAMELSWPRKDDAPN